MKKTVYYGKQQFLSKLWREVAIKVIEYEERSLNELKLLMKLSHPYIVQLIDADKQEGNLGDRIYIVMELCSQNLRDYVEKHSFNFENSFRFSGNIVEGLVFLHRNNVIHRDLKPDNVLISMDKRSAKLSDFGLCQEIPIGHSGATVSAIGVGTGGFRAPETYQNITHVSPSIDVFAFGLVIHFIFSKGKHPYGSNPYECQVNITKKPNRDLTQIPQFGRPHVHKREQLTQLLRQTLDSEPSKRPTMKDIQESAFISGMR